MIPLVQLKLLSDTIYPEVTSCLSLDVHPDLHRWLFCGPEM